MIQLWFYKAYTETKEEELSLQQVVLGSLLTSFTLHDEKI